MKNNNYYIVQGWMINDLQLSDVDLVIFAIIYGFSQDGESQFTGSINHLCQSTLKSRPTVINSLKRLVEIGYLKKISNTINKVTHNSYFVSREIINMYDDMLPRNSKNSLPGGSKNSLLGGSKNSLPGSKNSLLGGSKNSLLGGSKNSLPYNTILKNKDNNKDNIYLSQQDCDGDIFQNKSLNLDENINSKNSDLNKDFIQFAEQLKTIVQKTKNINIPKSKLNSWANSFRLLNSPKYENVSTDRIQNILDWYAGAAGGDYIPVVESGKAFREKFTKLESAMQRSKKPKSQTQNNITIGTGTNSGYQYKKSKKHIVDF